MSMLDFTVDTITCTRCGECVADCPARIIAMEEGIPTIAPDKESACYRCQHCLAICPTEAVSILRLKPTGSIPLSGNLPDLTNWRTSSRDVVRCGATSRKTWSRNC